jgi:hypothetical protein
LTNSYGCVIIVTILPCGFPQGYFAVMGILWKIYGFLCLFDAKYIQIYVCLKFLRNVLLFWQQQDSRSAENGGIIYDKRRFKKRRYYRSR